MASRLLLRACALTTQLRNNGVVRPLQRAFATAKGTFILTLLSSCLHINVNRFKHFANMKLASLTFLCNWALLTIYSFKDKYNLVIQY